VTYPSRRAPRLSPRSTQQTSTRPGHTCANVSYDGTLLSRAQAERFTFDWDLVQLGPFTLGEICFGAGVDLISPDLVSTSVSSKARTAAATESRPYRPSTAGPEPNGRTTTRSATRPAPS
jgi:hypothetical protein